MTDYRDKKIMKNEGNINMCILCIVCLFFIVIMLAFAVLR